MRRGHPRPHFLGSFGINGGKVNALFVTSTATAARLAVNGGRAPDLHVGDIAEIIAPFPHGGRPGGATDPPGRGAHSHGCAVGPAAEPMLSPKQGSEPHGTTQPDLALARAYIVADEKCAEGRARVPLREVFACTEWAELVDQRCPPGLFLVATTFGDLKNMPGLKLLSYRWSEVVDVTCAVRVPGEAAVRVPKPRRLAVDALRAFSGVRGVPFTGCMWVDFLCHLDDPEAKQHVLRR
jgi:hypothetical protein